MQSQQQPGWDLMRSFVSLFLEGQSLHRVMVYLCNTSSGLVVDPITDTICIMITSPLALAITEVGVAPFSEGPAHVYPYTEMSAEQQDFLRDVVQSYRDCAGGGQSGRLTASLQMGGGHVVEILQPAGRKTASASQSPSLSSSSPAAGGRQPMYLKAESVLSCLCRAVMEGGGLRCDEWQRRAVCNILLQRVSSAIYMPRETLQKVGEELEKMHCPPPAAQGLPPSAAGAGV